jgi:cell fate regulator YaaT (PSP1 superfamily)
VVEASTGYDVGIVSLAGELVRVQMNRREVKDNYELKRVLRKAVQSDFDIWQAARQLETGTMTRSREISRELGLQMKISDVEYQGDKTRAIFYYTADDRVDFRELIRKYAEEFKVRIEMRQIGLRLEAGRLGGIGSCGRELCCSTWLTDFRSVSTGAARYQQLSLNPGKLAGQCGKLKCCLNYELDQYVEAVRMLPPTHVKLKLPKGIATHFKTDIFKQVIYYTIEGQHSDGPFALSAEVVKDIIEKNKRGEIIGEVQTFIEEKDIVESVEFAEVVGQDSLTRFDNKKRKPNNNNRNRNSKPGGNANRPAAGTTSNPQTAAAPKEGNRPAGNGNRPPRFKGKPNNPNQGPKE